MIKNAVFSALAIAATLAVSPASATNSCPPPKIVASVPILPLKDGRFVIPVVVNGQRAFFLLGLANEYGMIGADLAAKLNLPQKYNPARFVGLDGQIVHTMGRTSTLDIGAVEFTDREFAVGATGYTYQTQAQPGDIVPSGSIGTDLVRAYDVDLDFGAGKLNLIVPSDCSTATPYWNPQHLAKVPMTFSDQHRIKLDVSLDGHSFSAALNTAIPHSTLEMRAAKLAFDVENASPGNQQIGSLNADTPLYASKFKSVSFGDVDFDNPTIVLMPDLVEDALRDSRPMAGLRSHSEVSEKLRIPEFMLGVAELRGLHVYIDFHNQVLYISPASDRAAGPKATD